MAEKQSVINLSWTLDTSNFDKARYMTDNLKNSFESLRNPLTGVNDAINKMHDQLGSVKDGYRGISDVAKSLYNNNRGITDSLRVMHEDGRNVMNDYQMINSKANDLTSTYKDVLATSAKLTESTQKTVIATQQLRQSLIDLNKVKPVAPTVPYERTSSSGHSSVVNGTVKDHSLRNTVIGGGIAGIVGSGISALGNYVSSSAKSAFAIAENAQNAQLAWHTMGVNSQKDVAQLSGQVGDLRSKANIAGADITQTQRNLYNATNGNVEKTKELTDAMFAYGKASNQTDQQISQASGSMGRLFNSSKVRGTAFTRITKQMPAMRNAIIQASGESSAKFMSDMNAGKISGQELEQLMVKSAQNSGKAWEQYGNTAKGALARLQGSTTSIWIATMKGIAVQTNSGLVQLSKLVSQNIQPISKMMIGVGNAGAKIVGSAITFLVKNQKPLGSIAHSLIDIAGTVGKAVWSTFSGVIQAIGTAFGVLTGNSKKSNNPIQTTANLLKDVASHKKAIEAITIAFTGMFMVKKATQFAGALKQVAGSVGLINSAESMSGSNSKSGILGTLLDYGTSIGGSRKAKPQLANRFDDSFSLTSDKKSLASNLNGASLGKLAEKESSGVFRSAKDVKVGGSFLSETSKLGRFGKLAGAGSMLFGSTKLGSLVDKGGLKTAQGLTKFGSSGLLKSVTGVASKVPFLDVAAAGLNMVGTNKHNVGSKAGSSIGMLAGSIGGGVFGGPLGAIAGGMAGQALGGTIGKKIQHAIPKNAFKSIENSWNSLTNKISHSSFAKSITGTFNTIKKTISSTLSSIGREFKPVTQGIGQFVNAAKKTGIVKWYLKNAGDGFKILGTVASVTFKGIASVIKGVTVGIGTFLKNAFGGIFKTVGGIFKTGADLLTGRWSRLGSDLGQIGNGILQVMESPFKGAWSAIKSIGSDIIGFVKNIWSSISHLGSKIANIAKHPIKSIESMFATGTTGRYPKGLPNTTRAVVNDGNGPELISFGGNLGMYKGRNVHTVLPKGSHVFNAGDTRRILNNRQAVHFASGTGFENKRSNINSTIHVKFNGLNMKSELNMTKKYTAQVIGLIKRAYSGINRSSSVSLRKMATQTSRLWKTNNTNMKRELSVMSKQNSNVWKGIDRDTARQQKIISRTADSFSKALTKSLANGANDMNKQLDNIWESITSDFKGIFAKLGPYAHSGMNGAVDQLNGGISGIDKALSQFGGNSSVLQPIHYASGTDAVDHTHLAMVNDASSGFQNEAILSPNGGVRYASGRNALTVLHKGESVLNGADTQTAISKGYIPRHASGVGSKKALRALAKKNASDFTDAFNSEFTSNVSLTGSDLQKGIINSSRAGSANDSNGYNWSHAMWSVIKNAMSSVGASATGLLKAVEKYGTGHKYVWGATGPDAFDCSGLVQYALKQMGIEYPRTSGEQIAKAQHISRAQAEPGDLIGNSEHIGVVADKGAHHYFSAFNPSSHPNILMTPVNGSYFPGTPQFGRVSGINNKSKKSDSSSGIKGVSKHMQSLVKSQLGSKALSWISKKLGTSISASGNPAGDGVQRWRPDVVKALSALHLSTSSSMVDRVLRQINTESSGNPSAMGGTDGLNDGRAMGLMQVKPGTFKAYGKPSLGGWNNGMASIYAGLNYAKHRYGDSLSFLGQGHGYARGGRPPLHKSVLVGEEGPEIAEFDSPVKIHPHNESKKMASGLGNHITMNPKITINIKGSASKSDARKSAKTVREEIIKVLSQIFTDAEIEQAFNS